MQQFLLFLWLALAACNRFEISNPSEIDISGETYSGLSDDDVDFSKQVPPNCKRYDSLCKATSLPKAFFIYADSWDVPYEIDISKNKKGYKKIECKVALNGWHRQGLFHLGDALEFISAQRTFHINGFLIDSSYKTITYIYLYDTAKSDQRRVITNELLADRINRQDICGRIDVFLGNHGFVPVSKINDSGICIDLLLLDSDKVNADKLRKLSPFIITAILKDSTRQLPTITYVESWDKEKTDTALKVYTKGW